MSETICPSIYEYRVLCRKSDAAYECGEWQELKEPSQIANALRIVPEGRVEIQLKKAS